MAKPFKMDLLLQHSCGAHSAVNDGGWAGKEEGQEGDVGFRLPRPMDKWKYVSSPLNPPPSFLSFFF